jgi:membrane protease YdiL (CAAX protease family)
VSIKKVDRPENSLNVKFVVTITLLYFLVVFPGIQFFLRDHAWLPQYGHAIYFAVIFAYVWGIKKTPLSEVGFSRQHLGNHLLIGILLGGLMVSALPFLDTLVSLSGLDQNELFSDNANQRNADDWKSLQPLGLGITVLILPLLAQFFFTGLIYQSLSKKVDPMLALFGGALIFTLGHFKLNLGLFILGVVTSFLYRLTGTLYASILFHMGCALAGILLLYSYPRLITILVFLF